MRGCWRGSEAQGNLTRCSNLALFALFSQERRVDIIQRQMRSGADQPIEHIFCVEHLLYNRLPTGSGLRTRAEYFMKNPKSSHRVEVKNRRSIPQLGLLRSELGKLVEFRGAGSYKWDVFISYSSRDFAKAAEIAQTLTGYGLRVWFDRSAIQPGDRLREAISHGIRDSAMLLLLFSPHSQSSGWVLNELDSAMLREVEERKTVVLPVLIGNTQADQLPEDLKGKRYVDLRYKFRDKLARELDSIVAVISIATFGTLKPLDGELLLGPESVRFFLDYEYSGTYLSAKKIPYEVFVTISEGVIDTLLSQKKSASYTREFLFEYGMAVARQIVLFIFDQRRLDFVGGFPQSELSKVCSEAGAVMMLHNMHRKLDQLKIFKLALSCQDQDVAVRMVKITEPESNRLRNVGRPRRPLIGKRSKSTVSTKDAAI